LREVLRIKSAQLIDFKDDYKKYLSESWQPSHVCLGEKLSIAKDWVDCMK